MAAVLAHVHSVDDVETTLCVNCAGVHPVREGWQGHCPSCCALVDDHDARRHDRTPVTECRACDAYSPDRLELSAIA